MWTFLSMLGAAASMILLFLAGAAFRPYLSGYAVKKGENLATHEDIDKLVNQVKVVTETTKRIEAEISEDVWNRQKRWELKRDLLFDLTRKGGELKDAFTNYQSICVTNAAHQPASLERNQRRLDAGTTFNTILNSFDNAAMLVGLVCEKGIYVSTLLFGQSTRNSFLKMSSGETTDFDAVIKNFGTGYAQLHDDIRKSLGLMELKQTSPRTTECSVAPAPTSPK